MLPVLYGTTLQLPIVIAGCPWFELIEIRPNLAPILQNFIQSI